MRKNLLKAFLTFVLLVLVLGINSCKKEDDILTNPTSGGSGGSLTGYWNVDQIQMVQAPPGGTFSTLMKAALVPFGLVSASTIGVNAVRFGAERWYPYDVGVSGSPKWMQFLNSQTGWVGTDYYKISFTNNGGVTWNEINTPSKYYTSDFYFINDNTGYARKGNANDDSIYVTTNNGINWTRKPATIPNSYNNYLNGRMCFNDINNGFVLRYNNLYQTTNGGNNWISKISNFTNSSKLQFINSQNGIFFCTENGVTKMYKTQDGGNTWNSITCSSFNNNNYYSKDFHFINLSTGWVSVGYLYNTVDGGLSWTKINPPTGFSRIMFSDDLNGYGISDGNAKKVYMTSDGGDTWNMQNFSSTINIYDLYTFGSNSCYAIGKDGNIGRFYIKSNSIDTSVWTITGKITNPAIQAITKTDNSDFCAIGNYSYLNNNIVFVVNDYSGGMGNVTTGAGTYSFGLNTFTLNLNLNNEEKWKLILRRQ